MGSTSSFEYEMSQEGFSAAITSVSGFIKCEGKEERCTRVWGRFSIEGTSLMGSSGLFSLLCQSCFSFFFIEIWT